MSNLQGSVGEIKFTVQITRKDTGLTEEHEMVGFVDEQQLKALQEQGLLPTPPKE